jgi:hypothetical protein
VETIVSHPPPSLLSHGSGAWRLLNDAARDARIVVFCGIPGVGKSLLLCEQIHIAMAAGRKVSLLQWDVSRQAFETPDILRRYPEVGGSTHVIIRRAVGLWAREALCNWIEAHPEPPHMLLVEAPLIGGRLSELAHRLDDDAEALLSRSDVQFYIPTPTVEVRRTIEAARRAEMATNRHARDAANAIPTLVDELWQMVAATARKLRIECADSLSVYSPDAYFAVYQAVLRHRVGTKVLIDEVVPIHGSPHEFDFLEPIEELAPPEAQVPSLIAQAEREGHEAVASRAALWYDT